MLRAKDWLFLRLHAWGLLACGLTSMVVGLIVWISTLRTRTSLGDLWARKSLEEQSALQKQVRNGADEGDDARSWNADGAIVLVLRVL